VTRRPALSPLGLRLAAAFITVAVGGIVIFAVLTVTAAQRQITSLVHETHRDDAAAAAAAYADAGGWSGADLSAVLAVAARGQATLTVLGPDGDVVAVPADEAARVLEEKEGIQVIDVPRDQPVRSTVVVDGATVGAIELNFPASHLPVPEEQVQDALWRTAIVGAIVAIATAVAVALFVARRVSRPISALTEAAAELESGKRGVQVALEDAPGELGTLSAVFDRMSRAVEREDALRRQVVRDVAHEVRTPLTILRGTTEALVDGVLPADPATLASLHDEVLLLSQLVGDLETLAAAEAATLHLDSHRTDLAEVARAAVELAGPAAADAELHLNAELVPAPIEGDEARLRQVVINLIANALRYTPPGGRVEVRTEVRADRAILEVLDDGPGIDEEDLPRLFERFYRGKASVGTTGTGIGLAVAAELVTAHGGSIEAEDRSTGGARFQISLPVAPPA
jgi:two-component system sensor histidine kinase BaeS